MKKNKHKSRRKTRQKPLLLPNYKLEQSDKIDITANAGMFLLGEFCKQVDLLEELSRLGIFQRKKIDEAVHILSLVLNHFSGGEVINDTQYIKEDKAMCSLFGDIHIPAPHTSGDFLERFNQEYVEKLRAVIHRYQERGFRKLRRKLGDTVTTSVDSSVYESFGNTIEGTALSYKYIFGYHPLFMHLHNTGELLDVYLREGNVFSSNGSIELLGYNIRRLAKYFNRVIILADAAFFDQKIIRALEQLQGELNESHRGREITINFIITSETNGPIKTRLNEEEREWTPLVKNQPEPKTAHRDSHSFNYRFEDLKSRLAAKGKLLRVRGDTEITDFIHEVPSWKKSYRFIYKRQEIKVVNPGNQLELLEEYPKYFYHGYITNIEDMDAEEIVRRINSRGHQEKFIEDFKNGLGTVHIPTKNFHGNYAYFLISMLSWNLKYWLLEILLPDQLIHWKRFRYLFIKVGAQIISSARYVIIRFGKGFKRFDEFVFMWDKLKAVQSE